MGEKSRAVPRPTRAKALAPRRSADALPLPTGEKRGAGAGHDARPRRSARRGGRVSRVHDRCSLRSKVGETGRAPIAAAPPSRQPGEEPSARGKAAQRRPASSRTSKFRVFTRSYSAWAAVCAASAALISVSSTATFLFAAGVRWAAEAGGRVRQPIGWARNRLRSRPLCASLRARALVHGPSPPSPNYLRSAKPRALRSSS